MTWLTAAEALAVLGTQPQTLYANVSRGRIRAKPDPKEARRSLYNGDDVRRLAQRGAGRRKSAAVAAEAIRWGDPILPSALSTIVSGRLFYRGRDAILLAETAMLEEVASLLWASRSVRLKPSVSTYEQADAATPNSALRAAFTALAARAAVDPPSLGRAPVVLHAEAASVLAAIADAMLAGGPAMEHPLHRRIAAAWGCPQAEDLIRQALVLLADHELNASTFAARVTISTGASLSAAVLAGLAALTGPLHGGASAGVQALAAFANQVGAEDAVHAWLAQGRPIPSFGHRLYPEGDSRAKALLERFDPPSPFPELRLAAERIVGEQPNIDFALAALTAAYGWPPQAPLILFALARTVGWIAHALEQIATGDLIRPRAHYVGAPVSREA